MKYTLKLMALLFMFSCGSAESEPQAEASSDNNDNESKTTVVVEAESFVDSSGEFEVVTDDSGAKAVKITGDGAWLAYEVDVMAAGRYKVDLKASNQGDQEAILWVEDYYKNEDGRTYNITSDVPLASSDDKGKYAVVFKEGSPLNEGKHEMKVHLKSGDVLLDNVTFSMMRAHQLTPKTMTQSDKTEGDNWVLVWSDEFDEGTQPDTSKWTYDIGNWGWGNNEPQYYTENRTENARIEDGSLIIEARKDDMGQPWTSARLTTRGKVSFLYGKIEFRAKVPVADGTWAAGWFLGDAYRDEISWPYCGEIDVLECVGKEIDDETGNGINHASCHTRAYYFKQGNHISETIPVEKMNTEYHSYTIEWKPDGIKAFLDGEHYYTYDKVKDDLEWPFKYPQNLIVNLAMGGGMGGAINPEIDRQQFILDYIRVYELQ